MNNEFNFFTLLNTILTSITTFCALYLAYVALKHSATPNIKIKMLNDNIFICKQRAFFVFECTNIGYWYAKPTAINVTVFCNFAPDFELLELRYGSNLSYVDADAKIGVGKMRYLKAKGLKLTHGEEGEAIQVKVITPKDEGDYKVRLTAYSDNGVSYKQDFLITCKNT